MFDWFRSKARERRKKLKLDRKHVERRARRFLKNYLDADEMRKTEFYRVVQDISDMCRPAEVIGRADLDDSRIAEAASQAAMKMVLDRTEGLTAGQATNFETDACATVAVAYHRAAGVYVGDYKLQELGTAAVHLLTMATSYMSAHEDSGRITNDE